MGYEVLDVDMINMEELKGLVYSLTNKQLPLSQWYEKSLGSESIEEDGKDTILGDLKEYLDENYSWLWNTTYWTKTLVENTQYDAYFVSSSGDICYTESNACNGIPRAGVRPVVTISSTNIDYAIETKTDGNGTVAIEKVTASGGEVIKFTVTPKDGYVLSEVKVTDSEGNIVTITDYTFTMPNASVLVEAKFVPENPNTKTFLTIIPIIVFIAAAIVYVKTKTKVY